MFQGAVFLKIRVIYFVISVIIDYRNFYNSGFFRETGVRYPQIISQDYI